MAIKKKQGSRGTAPTHSPRAAQPHSNSSVDNGTAPTPVRRGGEISAHAQANAGSLKTAHSAGSSPAPGSNIWLDPADPRTGRLALSNIANILRVYFSHRRTHKVAWRPMSPAHVEVPFCYPFADCVCGHDKGLHTVSDTNRGTNPEGKLPFNGPCLAEHCRCPRRVPVYLTGRIDLLGFKTYEPGHCVVDTKTQRPGLFAPTEYEVGSQACQYLWAATQYVGTFVDTFYINWICISELPSSNTKCKEHKLTYAECSPLHAKFETIGPIYKHQYQIDQWAETVRGLIARYYEWRRLLTIDMDRDTTPSASPDEPSSWIWNGADCHAPVPTEGMFNGSCRLCDFREWCHGGRRVPLSRAHTYAPYSPLDHAGIDPSKRPPGAKIDNSTLMSISRCTTQALAQYWLGYRRKFNPNEPYEAIGAAARHAGTAVHAAMEAFERGALPADAITTFKRTYTEPLK